MSDNIIMFHNSINLEKSPYRLISIERNKAKKVVKVEMKEGTEDAARNVFAGIRKMREKSEKIIIIKHHNLC